MPKITGGKIFYSNNADYLEGIKRGAEYVNDGPIVVGDVEKSDRGNYEFMLVLEDEDMDDVDVEEDDSTPKQSA